MHLEQIVRHFDRYHKYTLGTDLRTGSRRILERIIEANESRERRPVLEQLRQDLERLKVLARLCHESGGFRSTRAYLYVAEQVVASLPAGFVPATYVLVVSRGPAAGESDSLPVTIGIEGPAGPRRADCLRGLGTPAVRFYPWLSGLNSDLPS